MKARPVVVACKPDVASCPGSYGGSTNPVGTEKGPSSVVAWSALGFPKGADVDCKMDASLAACTGTAFQRSCHAWLKQAANASNACPKASTITMGAWMRHYFDKFFMLPILPPVISCSESWFVRG